MHHSTLYRGALVFKARSLVHRSSLYRDGLACKAHRRLHHSTLGSDRRASTYAGANTGFRKSDRTLRFRWKAIFWRLFACFSHILSTFRTFCQLSAHYVNTPTRPLARRGSNFSHIFRRLCQVSAHYVNTMKIMFKVRRRCRLDQSSSSTITFCQLSAHSVNFQHILST